MTDGYDAPTPAAVDYDYNRVNHGMAAGTGNTERSFGDIGLLAEQRVYPCSRDTHYFECRHATHCFCGKTARAEVEEGL